MEERLRETPAKQGEGELNRLRDGAAEIAPALAAEVELEQLHGRGWDDRRLDALMSCTPAFLTRRLEREGHAGSTFAFCEAYFSNFIEGTEFTLEEAEDVVFNGAIPPERPADAHDVSGAFDLVSDPSIRERVPQDAEGLEAVIQAFHRRIMASRSNARPGDYKEKANRACNTEFVAPALVEGTLDKGWERYATLQPGLERAIFALFLIAEVHPFADGNGRVARALANAELTAAEQQRIVIPTVLRDDYLHALRAPFTRRAPRPADSRHRSRPAMGARSEMGRHGRGSRRPRAN